MEGSADKRPPTIDGSQNRDRTRDQAVLGGCSLSLNLHQRPSVEAGNPDQFAIRIEFVENLDPGFATPEEDLSWGRLQIWADGQNLCEYVDRSEVRKAVEWYLLPTLEWLAEVWDFLLHEQRPPVSNSGETAWQSLAETNRPERFDRAGEWDVTADESHTLWTLRHCLRTCRFGGLFPDIIIRRWQDEVEFSWGESAQVGAPPDFRFLHGYGTARVSPDNVSKALYDLLRQAVTALAEEAPQSQRLSALQDRVTKIASAERQQYRTALLAGIGARPEDWLKKWGSLRKRLEVECGSFHRSITRWFEPAVGNSLCVSGTCEAAVMFGSAAPTLTEGDVLAIATYLVKSSDKRPSSRWTSLAKDPQPLRPGTSPWTDGYRLAQLFAQKMPIRHKHNGSVDIEGHLEKLGVSVTDVELEDATISGLAIQPAQAAPQILVNRRDPRCEFPSGKRFTLAHELCHLLHDREQGRNLAMISGPWAPRDLEKRANAFAAALLMPPELLKKGVHIDEALAFESLVILAKRLEVSPDALAHHLKNCGLISEATRDILLSQLVNRPDSAIARGS